MQSNLPRYVIVSPVRDEAAHIQKTLDSVVSQTVRPSLWVIVDDNSKDRTREIVQPYAEKHAWIRLIQYSDTGSRRRGGRVVQVFYAGHSVVDRDFDLLVKLDGDLSFDPDYFERLLGFFSGDPKLGIAGGECYTQYNGHLRLEKTPADHVRGPTKVYRKECFAEIGGLRAIDGWDVVDELYAQMKGWRTRGYEELVVVHHRPTGQAEGLLRGFSRQGQNSYFLGYSLPLILARSIYRGFIERPYLLSGMAIFYGFMIGWIKNKPKYEDPELRAFLRYRKSQRLASWRSSH